MSQVKPMLSGKKRGLVQDEVIELFCLELAKFIINQRNFSCIQVVHK